LDDFVDILEEIDKKDFYFGYKCDIDRRQRYLKLVSINFLLAKNKFHGLLDDIVDILEEIDKKNFKVGWKWDINKKQRYLKLTSINFLLAKNKFHG
jgi:hypothetical protein